MIRKAVLVARDFAGSYGLGELARELVRGGVECATFLGMGRPFEATPVDILRAVKKTDSVIVGRSSSADLAEPEIAAMDAAIKNKVPAYMYSDGWLSLLPWFRDYYGELRCLFVLHDYCLRQVKRVFPNVAVVVSGNPEWETFFPGPTYEADRQKVVEKLRGMGASSAWAKLILVPGVKDRDLNLQLWREVGQAAEQLSGNFCLVASMHPGDLNEPADYQNALAGLGLPKLFLHKGAGVGTAQVVPASTWVIASLSTLGDRACCQRKRVIDYATPQAMARFEQLNALLPVSERRIWPPCQAAASRLVTGGMEELQETMRQIRTKEGFAEQRKRQRRFYGSRAPSPGTAVKIMAEQIAFWQ